MRHRVKGRKLKRTSSHRRATLRALATALLKHKKIKTTLAKAKELRVFVEPLITKAKTDSVAAKRHVYDDIKDRDVLQELFGDISAKVGSRPGGYTRIVKLGQRKGDAAELAIIELVDYSGIVKPKAPKKEKAESVAPKTEETKAEAAEEKKPAKPKTAKPKKSEGKKETKEKTAPAKGKTKTTKKPLSK
ncbi:MAG: 50S ribosomal protein L17 [Ignavibacteriales bacterium]|nr:50S ribosomal protein L17 [Ignavibacteriales bacterium]